jgi:hypothetical protein
MRVVVAAVVVAALAAGCDDNSKTYKARDVEQAFHSQGFVLSAFSFSADPATPPSHIALEGANAMDGAMYANRGAPFMIVVYDHNSDAEKAIETLRSMASSETFNAQKGNVVIFSDDGVTAPTRKRIRAVLDELG